MAFVDIGRAGKVERLVSVEEQPMTGLGESRDYFDCVAANPGGGMRQRTGVDAYSQGRAAQPAATLALAAGGSNRRE